MQTPDKLNDVIDPEVTDKVCVDPLDKGNESLEKEDHEELDSNSHIFTESSADVSQDHHDDNPVELQGEEDMKKALNK